MLHPISQRIAHDREVIAHAKRERFRRRGCLAAAVERKQRTENGAEEPTQPGR
jgi:hypothetical protein